MILAECFAGDVRSTTPAENAAVAVQHGRALAIRCERIAPAVGAAMRAHRRAMRYLALQPRAKYPPMPERLP